MVVVVVVNVVVVVVGTQAGLTREKLAIGCACLCTVLPGFIAGLTWWRRRCWVYWRLVAPGTPRLAPHEQVKAVGPADSSLAYTGVAGYGRENQVLGFHDDDIGSDVSGRWWAEARMRESLFCYAADGAGRVE